MKLNRHTSRRINPVARRAFCEALESRKLLSLTVPAYSSLPGSSHTLYIDFDGSPAFNWNNGTSYQVHGPGNASAPLAAFTTDADAANFSTTDLGAIYQMWQYAAEKYSPFNINVTTVNPGNLNDNQTVRCIVSGSNLDWYGSGGGVGAIGGFSDPVKDNTCFMFSQDAINFFGNAGVGLGKAIHYLGTGIAHEAGHEFGVVHERTGSSPITEYYTGNGTTVPIMGDAGNQQTQRGIWWKTNMDSVQNSPDPIQDELSVLYGVLGSSPDPQNPASNANTNFSSNGTGSLSATGVINAQFDADGFIFTAGGPAASFTITSSAQGGMLVPRGELMTYPGNAAVTSTTVNSSDGTSTTIATSGLTAGQQYTLNVHGDFTYGSIGQYTVAGTTQTVAYLQGGVLYVNGFDNVADYFKIDLRNVLGINYINVEDDINGNTSQATSVLVRASDVTSLNISTKSGYDSVVILNQLGSRPIAVDMGDGINNLELDGSDSVNDFFSVYDSSTSFNNETSTYNGSVTALTLRGNAGSDIFNVYSLGPNLVLYGGDGNDQVGAPTSFIGSFGGAMTFSGDAGTDTFNVGTGTDSTPITFGAVSGNFGGYAITGSVNGVGRSMSYSAETVQLYGSLAADTFNLKLVPAGTTVYAYGNPGDDTFNIGDATTPYSVGILGTVSLAGNTGVDQVFINDTNSSGFFNAYTLTASSLINTSTSTNNNIVLFDSAIDQLTFNSSNHGSQYVKMVGIPLTPASIHLNAGTGAGDTLIVDDHTLSVAPFRVDFAADGYKEFYGTPASPTIRQLPPTSGFENFQVTAHASTNAFNISSLPASQYTTLNCGANADTVTFNPHDASGNLTINGSISIFTAGGSDSLVIDDSTSSTPLNLTFDNQFNIVDVINGLGAGTIGLSNDLELISVKGGSGDDAFILNAHKMATAIAIDGGDGNDTLDVTPTSKNISGNIASGANITFAGGLGNDSLRFHGDAAPYGLGFALVGTQLGVNQIVGAPSYSSVYNHTSVEYVGITGGPETDYLSIPSSPANTFYDFNGGPGNVVDQLYLGAQFNAFTNGIFGGVRIDGSGGGADTVSLYNYSETAGRTLHIGNGLLGGTTGDTVFGAGGYLQYANVAGGISVQLGSGADSVYAAPDAGTPINILAAAPTSAPGDTLNLALAAAQNAVVNGTASSGSVTSTNLKTLTWSGFESIPSVDNTAPAAISGNFVFDAAQQQAKIAFSENVSGLGLDDLVLTNLTSGQIIGSGVAALVYDSASKTATMTFPGLANGALPDGNYHLALSIRYTDAAGNAAAAPFAFDFFSLAGDANHDRKVNFSDLVILAQHYGSSGQTFGDGNFDYSANGLVDFNDLVILAQRYGMTLAAPSVVAATVAGRASGSTGGVVSGRSKSVAADLLDSVD